MRDHITQMCKGAWYHWKQLGLIKNYLDPTACEILIRSFVSSRLDNFNGLLHGIPKDQVGRLQHIQNAAARMIRGTKKFDHITPVLKKLH